MSSRITLYGLSTKDPLDYDKAMTLKARITAIKDVVAAIGLMITIAVLLGSALVFLIVGAWDGAVRLFKTDLQTTNFQVPVWAILVAIPTYLLNRMFKDWVDEATEEDLKELDERRISRRD